MGDSSRRAPAAGSGAECVQVNGTCSKTIGCENGAVNSIWHEVTGVWTDLIHILIGCESYKGYSVYSKTGSFTDGHDTQGWWWCAPERGRSHTAADDHARTRARAGYGPQVLHGTQIAAARCCCDDTRA
jgi:hypothetical protein